MTLQDAQPDIVQGVIPSFSATPIELAEMPTNPLLPAVRPEDISGASLSLALEPAGALATSEIIPFDMPAPFDAQTAQSPVGVPAPPPVQGIPISYPNPLAYPGISAPNYPPIFPPQTPLLTPASSRGRLDAKALLALSSACLLLVSCIGVLIFNFGYYQPYRLHAAATATGLAIPTITAHAAQTDVASYEQTHIAQQTATTTAEQTIYHLSLVGKPVIDEALKQQSDSGWDEGVVWKNASCTFENEGYVIYQPNTGYFVPCFAENPTFANFALQVDMHVLQGDSGGVFFRANSEDADGYLFEVDNYGDYALFSYTNDSSTTLLNGRSYAYQTDKKNRLTIIAKGTTFYLYLNGQFVDSASDSTFTLGHIGLIGDATQNTTIVAYSRLKIWQLF